ncbi:PQQ-dependent sugar dehydrogenase [Candidatus Pelagibacter ubique]|nr:PQQ-dependent sugar dehydrogenase [Candidatus Pelagibacter ubique]
MLNKKKKLIIVFLISIIFIGVYLFTNSIINMQKFNSVKSLLNNDTRQLIKKYIFPHKIISEQKKKISKQEQIIFQLKSFDWTELELQKKMEGSEIITKESIVKLSNNKFLKKFQLTSGFYSGVYSIFPGSGYIDFHNNNIIVLSSRGVLAYKKNISDVREKFKQIKNNINEFIGLEQFKKSNGDHLWFSLKDILIFNDKVFISYTKEIKKDCWNTSIIYGDINYEKILFKELFSPKRCIHSTNNIDKVFNAHQSGGAIINLNDKHILLSIGDFRERHYAQNLKSVNGKIIKVNIDNGDYQIYSMGHRNPQGLFFDEENNFILETEHGPKGGDEINLINKKKKDEIQNFGWAISSAGEHYVNYKSTYEKYPLYNSHKEYGFIEPLKSFTPSIGISDIEKIGKNKYVISSLKDKSLYFFELNEQKQIFNLDRVEVFERIRDLRFNNNQLYLFMEDTASIGVINLN